MNVNKLRIIFFVIISCRLLGVPFANSQNIFQPKVYDKDVAIKLIYQIKSGIDAVHPNPYHSISEHRIDSLISAEVLQLPDSLDELSLYKFILPIVNSYNDGHIQLVCPFGKFLNRAINENKGVFPLTLFSLNGDAYVKLSIFDSIVKPGYKLISIDGVEIHDIIRKYSNYKFGDNLQSREKKAVQDFIVLEYFENGAKDAYILGYQKGEDAPISQVVLPSARRADIINFNQSYRDTVSKREYFSHPLITMDDFIYFRTHPSRNMALLTLPSFSIDKAEETVYVSKIDSIFEYLSCKGVDTLLIDIRENSGGRDFPCNHILSHIATENYLYGKAQVKISLEQQNLYKMILKDKLQDSTYRESAEYYNFFQRRAGDVFSIDSSFYNKSERPYKGKIFLLIGPNTYSAAVSFAAACKCYGFATLVGEETGGLTTTYTSLVPVSLSVPSVQLKVAHRRVINACGSESHESLYPNILVKKTKRNYLQNADEVIEYLLSN